MSYRYLHPGVTPVIFPPTPHPRPLTITPQAGRWYKQNPPWSLCPPHSLFSPSLFYLTLFISLIFLSLRISTKPARKYFHHNYPLKWIEPHKSLKVKETCWGGINQIKRVSNAGWLGLLERNKLMLLQVFLVRIGWSKITACKNHCNEYLLNNEENQRLYTAYNAWRQPINITHTNIHTHTHDTRTHEDPPLDVISPCLSPCTHGRDPI